MYANNRKYKYVYIYIYIYTYMHLYFYVWIKYINTYFLHRPVCLILFANCSRSCRITELPRVNLGLAKVFTTALSITKKKSSCMTPALALSRKNGSTLSTQQLFCGPCHLCISEPFWPSSSRHPTPPWHHQSWKIKKQKHHFQGSKMHK